MTTKLLLLFAEFEPDDLESVPPACILELDGDRGDTAGDENLTFE
jgi:hypothetical protein